MQAASNALRSTVHNIIDSVQNKKDLATAVNGI
jgi:hypothetical protein